MPRPPVPFTVPLEGVVAGPQPGASLTGMSRSRDNGSPAKASAPVGVALRVAGVFAWTSLCDMGLAMADERVSIAAIALVFHDIMTDMLTL
jgi:hypothetical protein